MPIHKKPILRHLIFWLLFWFLQSLLFGGGHSLDFYMAKNVAIVSLQALVVYTNLHLLSKLLTDKRYLVYAVSSAILTYLVFAVSFEVIDITGKKVISTNEGNKGAGTYSINLNTAELNAGIYFYSIVVDGNRITKKMTITK